MCADSDVIGLTEESPFKRHLSASFQASTGRRHVPVRQTGSGRKYLYRSNTSGSLDICAACGFQLGAVVNRVTAKRHVYHRQCFKCSRYVMWDVIYCELHYLTTGDDNLVMTMVMIIWWWQSRLTSHKVVVLRIQNSELRMFIQI